MSTDVSVLLSSQQEIHGRISRSMENLKKMGTVNITLSAIDSRVKIIDQLWKRFEAQHDQIRSIYKEKFSTSETAQSDFLDLTEIAYVSQRSLLTTYAAELTKENAHVSVNEQQSDPTIKTSLPRIKLQSFSGAYEDWPSFRDLFVSLIGGNPSVSNIERFHYLRSCLQGPAEKLISPLAVTGDNYSRAWALLSAHYENKRELIRINFAKFTAVPKMRMESADELSRIYNAVTAAVNAQESIGRPIESHGMDLFMHLVVELFDPHTRLEWESSTSDSTDPPSCDALMGFITKRVLTLNAAKSKPSVRIGSDGPRAARSNNARPHAVAAVCALCKGNHSVMHCTDFHAKSVHERKAVVDAKRLCFNCLGNHFAAQCQSLKSCSVCKVKHHTLLHGDSTPSTTDVNALTSVRHRGGDTSTLLATARVLVAGKFGDNHEVRALLDQGSEVSIVTEALVQRLKLSRRSSGVAILGVGGAQLSSTRGRATLTITSKITGAAFTVEAYVLPRVSIYQGAGESLRASWPHLQGLQLADPTFNGNDPVELLLGAEVCSQVIQNGIRKGGPRAPIAQRTSLGWILSGGFGATSPHGVRGSMQCSADRELAELVTRFWEQEMEPPVPIKLTPEDEKCEGIFIRTHKRMASGRYVVRLPFASPPRGLAETRKPAERMLETMTRKGQRDPAFGKKYRLFMEEYESLCHMEVARTPADDQHVCYLPHHGVLRGPNTTSKMRVVFNGSQRGVGGESLNTYLLTGENLLPALADVLVRWRWHRYVLVADIEKMYRQILIDPADREYQRILWSANGTDITREYTLNTVTYGLACSPYLAIRTLRQLADDERERFLTGTAALRDCYVDDIVTGASTLSGVRTLQMELRGLCMAGGFPLRKWAANDPRTLDEVPFEHRLSTATHLWEDSQHATLGLLWHLASDCFAFQIEPRTLTETTRRRVLAETARLFDPLGWLAPVTIRAKIMIQSAWLTGLHWDAPLPTADSQLWKVFLEDLPSLRSLRIARWLKADQRTATMEVHGFADASERGYAAAVYLRTSSGGSSSARLVAAKSKVAPLKTVSLLRLELCAAALLTKLVCHLRATLSLGEAPLHLWSDSSVTLSWLRSHPSRWTTFVANRVALIQERAPEAQWRHVPGRDNPADCASRGIAPSDLLHHPLWWSGPAWLSQSKVHWPPQPDAIDGEIQDARVTSHTASIIRESELLRRFSSLHRLSRVTAWCFRWLSASRRSVRSSRGAPVTLQAEEIDDGFTRWLRIAQRSHYPVEISALEKKLPVVSRSTLAPLSPFLDERKLLRVGRRLQNSGGRASSPHFAAKLMVIEPRGGLLP